jgi:hypothetical protein
MKRITAYEANDGSLHRTKHECAITDLIHLGKVKSADSRVLLIGINEAALIARFHKEVIAILAEIDAPKIGDAG